ncbi:hypothetical protein [Mangrovibacterium marinum]|uniref:Uncharacterized protein n=1 Tax=Mangrovibacterium marinum TaxID=1639118 RepID=A0A2T5BZH9_9BACT|nr:hypothetical protein [Mangrovibacterium marinum]PTN07692.1 hypothetical protein C8N47_11435 [Mangrovibacterium marinum]
MIKKSILALLLLACCGFGVSAQRLKGPEAVSYFQAPSNGIEFTKADVYLSNDDVLEAAKKEETKSKISGLGSKLGGLGNMVAGAANSAIDATANLNKMLDAYKDDKGRFGVWSFVPPYVQLPEEVEKRVNVEIFVFNEDDPSPSASMPTTPDKDGYYDIPYYVNCRYKVVDQRGNVLLEENLGVLQGSSKTKDYTPAAPASSLKGSIGAGFAATKKDAASQADALASGDLEDEVPIQYQIGTNAAYNAVRTAVFARYGFGQFFAPIKLAVIKESKESKKMIAPTLAAFEGKKGLLLTKPEKEQVAAFAREMEQVLPAVSSKEKWAVLHNLSVCYAWLEDAAKASDYYQQYTDEIQSTIGKMEYWNKFLNAGMKERMAIQKEMKEKFGSSSLGTAELKQYQEYNNIRYFVNYYPAGANRYQPMLTAINRDLKRFVDFYAVNDLLCQMFEIDFPYQFFPLNDFAGSPKDMRATVVKEGMAPIEYRVKFNSKREIKELAADQVAVADDGSKVKLETRDIMPQYDADNKYTGISTDAGFWAQVVADNTYTGLNAINDPLLKKTYGIANNITKNVGLFGGKASDEKVQLKVDLDGNLYFTGSSSYYRANSFFKEMLNSMGVEAKRVDTRSEFFTKANINEDGVMTSWNWQGDVVTNFGGVLSGRVQRLSAKPMVRSIDFEGADDKGNPTKIDFNFKLDGTMELEEKAKGMAFVNKYIADLNGPLPTISKDTYEFDVNTTWACAFEYDDQGNWVKMKIGPYTAERTFKY